MNEKMGLGLSIDECKKIANEFIAKKQQVIDDLSLEREHCLAKIKEIDNLLLNIDSANIQINKRSSPQYGIVTKLIIKVLENNLELLSTGIANQVHQLDSSLNKKIINERVSHLYKKGVLLRNGERRHYTYRLNPDHIEK